MRPVDVSPAWTGLPSDRPAQYGGPARVLVNVAAILALAAFLGVLGEVLLSADRMRVVWPTLASTAVFACFARIFWLRSGAYLSGEIGFVYLGLVLVYTVVPALKIVAMDFNIPLTYDQVGFAALSPTPEELGWHCWRMVLFMAGVSAGFLVVRTRPLHGIAPAEAAEQPRHRFTIAVLTAVIIGCIGLEVYLSQNAGVYVDHYTRFDHLSESWRRFAQVALVLKSGGYFTLLVLLFANYREHRGLIYLLTALFCAFEITHSLGARIEAFVIMLGVFGLYHYRVQRIGLKKGAALLVGVALLFSLVGLVRVANYQIGDALKYEIREESTRGSELDSVLATSFHVYQERARGTLPLRDWRLFFWEFISLVPFIDHVTYHPQYWYARHYFPGSVVPPTTLGVVAESGLWGGEPDLLVRSLLNGAIFAWLTRWFLRRRDRWWALTVYIYCYATCVLTLKYSVLYQIIPLVRVVLPSVVLVAVLFKLEAGVNRFGGVRIAAPGPAPRATE